MDDGEDALTASTLRRLAREFDGPELSKALAEFGFTDLIAAHPRSAVSVLFEAMGRAGTMSTALQDVLLRPLAEALGDIDADCAVVLPAMGAEYGGEAVGDTMTVHGVIVGRPAAALLVPVFASGAISWIRPVDPAQLSRRLVAGLDPALAMSEVAADEVAAVTLLEGPVAQSVWDAVRTAGRLALGYQIAGAVGEMIDLAVGHARDREQFGSPIGAFQAVRNRLVDAHVAKAGAAAALEQAWQADDQYLAGMLAKSLAGRAARIAATQCQQVLGGIGFTADHPFHRYLFRTTVLDSVLGSAAELPVQIGRHLVSETGAIPRLVEL
ncbi:acyl-CoA dehydrogenase family protein [Nocardia miyunensis]|uniref:acyl-CoA dehydrogenase family protein n=1 Tax=Nocardia miyunensis TaxID=282684 RepID=UPI000836FD2B|nr:acyl-CoA dehydrogenase family protein [Nocardia miyunensis]